MGNSLMPNKKGTTKTGKGMVSHADHEKPWLCWKLID